MRPREAGGGACERLRRRGRSRNRGRAPGRHRRCLRAEARVGQRLRARELEGRRGGGQGGLGLVEQGREPGRVGGAVAQLGRDDHLRLLVDDGLAVGALVEALVGRLHDPRVGVGEAALRLRLGPRRSSSSRRFSRRPRLRLRLRLQRLLRLLDRLAPLLPAGEFLRQLIATPIGAVARILGLVGRLGLLQQRPPARAAPQARPRAASRTIRSELIALRREALARSVVPSRATRPSLTSPPWRRRQAPA